MALVFSELQDNIFHCKEGSMCVYLSVDIWKLLSSNHFYYSSPLSPCLFFCLFYFCGYFPYGYLSSKVNTGHTVNSNKTLFGN